MSSSNSPKSTSRMIAALIAFAFINRILSLLIGNAEMQFGNQISPQNARAIAFLIKPDINEQVALLGSSMIETPFAKFEGENLDYDTRARLLEKQLSKQGSTIKVANMAIEGAMISDQYLILRKYLFNREEVLVLGISLRDFIDFRFRDPTNTYTYHALVQPTDIAIQMDYGESLGQFLTRIPDQLSPLFRYRAIITTHWANAMMSIIDLIMKRQPVFAINNIRSPIVSPAILASKDKANGAHSLPNMAPPAGLTDQTLSRFRTSVVQYQPIYNDAGNTASYYRHLKFLERILVLCHKQNISLLLINMPLTSINRSLMQPGAYERFKEDVINLARVNEITYKDADSSGHFKDFEDFRDTVHLNQIGGQKLGKLICPIIEQMLRQRRIIRNEEQGDHFKSIKNKY